MAKKKTILIIFGIVILIILIVVGSFLLYNNFKSDEPLGLKVHYYKDGVEVFPESVLQSFVTPPGIDIDQIAFDIIGTNEGDVDLSNIRITSSSDSGPNVFPASLISATPQTLLVGESKTLWNSSLMDTMDFESFPQPITFLVVVTGDYGPITTTSSISFNLTIEDPCLSEPVEILNSTYNLTNKETYVDINSCQHWSYTIHIFPEYYTNWQWNIHPEYTFCDSPPFYTEGGPLAAGGYKTCYIPRNRYWVPTRDPVYRTWGLFWIPHPADNTTSVSDYGGLK